MTRQYAFIGNNLSLDLVNTVGNISSASPTETLCSLSDLIEWSRQAHLVSDKEAKGLSRECEKHHAKSERIFQRVLHLRKSLYAIFRSITDGEAISKEDLAIFNRELMSAMSKAEIFYQQGELVWNWKINGLERILFMIARNAAELLTLSDLEKLKCCSGETCGWLFYDISKNNRRQWCDMRDCGNLAKARRFRVKKRIGR